MPNDITETGRHVYKFEQMTLWSHFLWRSLPTPPFMFATFALLLFLLLFTPVFVNTNRYVLVMARETLQTQIIHNLCNYIARSTTSRKGVDDENKHLTACVLGIVIGGENIDWQLPLVSKKTTVYKYRKQKDIKYVQPKLQRRRDALDRQPWWPQASALLDTFWELNQTQTIRLKSMTLAVQIITDMIPCLTTQEKRIEYA